jgi:hypothetical protein
MDDGRIEAAVKLIVVRSAVRDRSDGATRLLWVGSTEIKEVAFPTTRVAVTGEVVRGRTFAVRADCAKLTDAAVAGRAAVVAAHRSAVLYECIAGGAGKKPAAFPVCSVKARVGRVD